MNRVMDRCDWIVTACLCQDGHNGVDVSLDELLPVQFVDENENVIRAHVTGITVQGTNEVAKCVLGEDGWLDIFVPIGEDAPISAEMAFDIIAAALQ